MSLLNPATLEHIDAHINDSLSHLFGLLRIPSISADPAYKAQCHQAAEWLANYLTDTGFKAAVHETPGQPVVMAHGGPDDAPVHVLFYGHYDVQPADPELLWSSPPFEPLTKRLPSGATVIQARGASDDKGQLMTFLEACRALCAVDGALPVRVTVVLEGEEESGGENLPPFLEAHKDELKADIALVCDTNMANPETPAITTMLRGLVGEEVIIRAANRDLHSGLYGNAARNPITLLCSILAQLRNEKGEVALPGFYDNVPLASPDLLSSWAEAGLTDTGILQPVGLSIPAGEEGFTAIEQIWSRPALDINGISGGYEGDGFKTVLPAQARAKLSFRLVKGQDPERIRKIFRDFVQKRIPLDCSVEFISHGAAPAGLVSEDNPYLQPALEALGEEWGTKAVTIGSGGSIPVVEELQRILGLETLLVGFALEDDCIHSPNEKYNLNSFHKGIRSWARILYKLAEQPKSPT